jgi:hypothetical protein
MDTHGERQPKVSLLEDQHRTGQDGAARDAPTGSWAGHQLSLLHPVQKSFQDSAPSRVGCIGIPVSEFGSSREDN